MRVAIVGSRHFESEEVAKAWEGVVRGYVKRLPQGTVVISGGAAGVDSWAEDEAKKRGLAVTVFPVDKRGLPVDDRERKIEFAKRAYARNQKIVDEADILVAFWNGKSGGTADTLARARRAKMPYATVNKKGGDFVYRCTEDDPMNLYLEPKRGH